MKTFTAINLSDLPVSEDFKNYLENMAFDGGTEVTITVKSLQEENLSIGVQIEELEEMKESDDSDFEQADLDAAINNKLQLTELIGKLKKEKVFVVINNLGD